MRRTIDFLKLLRIILPMLALAYGWSWATAADSKGQAPETIAEIAIRIQLAYPDDFDWEGLARALIDLKPGDSLTVEGLQKAEQALAPIAQVQISTEQQPLGIRLTFILDPYRRIETIHVSGNYPLFERDVRNAMTIVQGDIFQPAQMPEQEKLIAQHFRDEGYIDPRVSITWQQNPSDGHYQLYVAIHKGRYYALKAIRFFGNHSVSAFTLHRKMTTWRRSTFGFGAVRFKNRTFKEDVRKLISYYRQKGFADVVITSEIAYEPDQHNVACNVTIDEGPRYEINFAGNSFFSDFTLRRDLVLFAVGNRGNTGLRRTINKIRRRYLQKGFAEVQVRWQGDPRPENTPERLITIAIEEGLRHIVKQVTVQGNFRVETKAIKKQMLTRPPSILHSGAYQTALLQEDAAAIRALYQSKGFLSARVDDRVDIDPRSGAVAVTILIDEGVQTIVEAVDFKGDLPFAEGQLRGKLKLKPGDPFAPFELNEEENQLAALISPLGYPYVTVKGAYDLSDDQTRANLLYTVAPGPAVILGEVFYAGNFRTRDRFLQRETGLKPGEPFALQKVFKTQSNLRDLDIFESLQVQTIGLKEKENKVDLLVRVAEKDPYYFEAATGYQTDKGFFGRSGIGDLNFLGTAKNLRTSAEASQVGYRWDGGITDSRFLGSALKADLKTYIERSEPFNLVFGTDTLGGTFSLTRDLPHHLTNSVALNYERRKQYLRDPEAPAQQVSPADLEPRSIMTVTPALQFDSRDSFIRPHSGELAIVSVDISKGLENSLDDFLRYTLDLRAYHSPMERLTLAGRAWAGYLEPYGNGIPPQDQLFFLGGTSTVRGFEENQLRTTAGDQPEGGRLAFLVSLESRIELGYNFELIPFVDTGSVQQTGSDGGGDGFRWSAGLGLQYLTPIGPAGIFYGFKLDRRPDESIGQLHISIGYTF